jgi:hypothetical protein
MTEILTDVVEMIENGDFSPDELQKIEAAIAKSRGAKNFVLGGEAVLNSKINPKYLRGTIVVVRKINDKSVLVDFPRDPSMRRYSGARGVRCPKTIVDPA